MDIAEGESKQTKQKPIFERPIFFACFKQSKVVILELIII